MRQFLKKNAEFSPKNVIIRSAQFETVRDGKFETVAQCAAQNQTYSAAKKWTFNVPPANVGLTLGHSTTYRPKLCQVDTTTFFISMKFCIQG